ncbi:MAG: nuclease (SNase) [Methylobacteriaceae bacterium]|nr:nuclease (SNase) [Methylobacteriaceae bacterium]
MSARACAPIATIRLFLATFMALVSLVGSAAACDADEGAAVSVAGVNDQFDIVLADGRRVALTGVAVARDAQGWPAFVDRLRGAELRLRSADSRPDRWGRIPGLLFARPAGQAHEPFALVARAALEAGLGRYRPDPAARPCRAELLAAEARARAAKRGAWAAPRFAVIDATDRKAVAAAPKGLVVVEGVVSAIGETRTRLYLNFGTIRTVDLAATISRRDLPEFEKRGAKVRDLAGRRVRIRGLIDRGFGPLIEVGDPDALELVGDGPPGLAPAATKG